MTRLPSHPELSIEAVPKCQPSVADSSATAQPRSSLLEVVSSRHQTQAPVRIPALTRLPDPGTAMAREGGNQGDAR